MAVIARMSKLCVLSIMAAFIVAGSIAGVQADEGNRDLIIVLDTSMSMVGQGGKNILDQVKQSLDEFIDQSKPGDSFSFMTFDSEVKAYPEVFLNDENDRDIVKKYLSVVEARGMWTHTMLMLEAVLKRAADLEKANPDRQRVIVIMTDGVDDPPPAYRGRRLNVKEVAKPYEGKDWFIYLVNLGDLKKSAGLAEVGKELSLTVSPFTKQIEAYEDPRKIISTELGSSIDEMGALKARMNRPWYLHPVFIVIIVVLLVVLVIFLLKRRKVAKVEGVLEFWDSGIMRREIYSFDLATVEGAKAVVGANAGVSLRIREYSLRKPVVIRAVHEKDGQKMILDFKEGAEVEILNGTAPYLEEGSSFKAGPLVFVYHAPAQVAEK